MVRNMDNNLKFKKRGFTLIELVIYSAILAISAGLIGGIVNTVTKSSLKTQSQNEVNTQNSRLEEVFRQKIEKAQKIKTLSGSLLSLNMAETSKNPTQFSLENNVVYLQEGTDAKMALNDPNKVKVTSLLFSPIGSSTSVAMGNHYAWSSTIGWVDFAYPGGNVKIPMGIGNLEGGAYVLSNGSWIFLNCSYSNSCSTSDFKVSSDANGDLSGWAWGEVFGWISFSSLTDGSTIPYGVKIATSTTANYDAGEWDGYAWSENIGWISFNCKTGGSNQVNICSTSPYKVQDLRAASTGIKIDITLEYASAKQGQANSQSNTFIFNFLNPSK